MQVLYLYLFGESLGAVGAIYQTSKDIIDSLQFAGIFTFMGIHHE
jgi:hypothetical protein